MNASALLFFGVVAILLIYGLRQSRRPLALALGDPPETWAAVLPDGSPLPPKSGDITAVIATGFRAGPGRNPSRERLWVVFDRQHLAAMRYPGRSGGALILERRTASPVVVSGASPLRKTVVFGTGELRLRAPLTTVNPLVDRLRRRGWTVVEQ